MPKVFKFFSECIRELKLVVWPSGADVWASVKVVVLSTVVISIILGLLDFGFTELFRFLMK